MSKIDTGFQYDSSGYTNPSVQIGLDRYLLEIIAALEGVQRICDLGCGNDRLALRLGERGHHVVGVDSSASGIALAGEAIDEKNAGFICAEIDEQLPETLSSIHRPFDLVVSNDVIEHLYRPRLLVDVALKILRPGGILILCTPYHGYLKNLALSVLNGWDAHHGVHWDGGHIKFFSVRTLTDLVTHAGFRIESFHFFGRMPWLWKNMICVAKKRHA